MLKKIMIAFSVIILLVVGIVLSLYFYVRLPKLNLDKNLSSSERSEKIDQWLKLLNRKGKFNGGILIVENSKLILMNTYGHTNYKKNEELTTQSSFRLASVSKQFTAVGIMLLKEKGLLQYDDSVSNYVNHFPSTKVTIRHLLNQVSGIPDIYSNVEEENTGDLDNPLSIQRAIKFLAERPVDEYESPNEEYKYNNTNYILLAGIIENISGETFENFMKENLFVPLKMDNTRVWNLLSEEKNFKNKTEGFEDNLGEISQVKPTWIDGIAGDGAIFSSLEDLLIWDQFWYGNSLLSKENLEEAFKKPILNNGEESDYGFGWVITKGEMWHNGKWLAANSIIIRNPKRKDLIVLLDSSSSLNFNGIQRAIFK